MLKIFVYNRHFINKVHKTFRNIVMLFTNLMFEETLLRPFMYEIITYRCADIFKLI